MVGPICLLLCSRLGDGCFFHVTFLTVSLGGLADWSADCRACCLLFDASVGHMASDGLEHRSRTDRGTARTTDHRNEEATQTGWWADDGRAGEAAGAAGSFDGVGPDT